MLNNETGMTMIEVIVSMMIVCTLVYTIYPITQFISIERHSLLLKHDINHYIYEMIILNDYKLNKNKIYYNDHLLHLEQMSHPLYKEVCVKWENYKKASEKSCFIKKMDFSYTNK